LLDHYMQFQHSLSLGKTSDRKSSVSGSWDGT